jgi:splicing factor 3B subunit 3
MHLYQLTLQQASQITHTVHGNFTGTKQQLICVARGKILEILRPDASSGKLVPVLAQDIFGVVRSLLPFRLTGGVKDFIAVGTDSGRITILEYQVDKNQLERVHLETFGKSGCRRIVPGQYLAVDPKGRALMIGALEKQKLVYILNRDASARLTISSPLEAHKAHTLVFDMVGVDVGFENPVFACLEMDYEEADQDPTGEAATETQQTLTFYELDLGLNHVVRKQSDELDIIANKLIKVPGGDGGSNDGPGGILLCSENLVTYRTMGDQPPISVRIPKRAGELQDPQRAAIVTAYAMHKHKHIMFFLLQTDFGDLFKLTLDVDDEEVKQLNLKYFDTVPIAVGLNLLKNGLLFVPSEFSNHSLYRVSQLGDNEDEPTFSTYSDPAQPFEFLPRELRNLVQIDDIENLAPVLACQVADLANEDTPQIYAACGQGPRSSLRALRHGLEVTQWGGETLNGNASGVWTVRQHVNDPFDSYIVVSFTNATLVLKIGDVIEEVQDSGFLGNVSTLSASRIGENALIQVYPDGIRHIRADKRVNEWKPPGKRDGAIVQCAVNERQVAIALTGGEITYFEMDRSGQLNEYSLEGSDKMEMDAEVTCMGVASVPPGLQRSRFLAVGCEDNTVRVVSLDPADCLQPLSMQALPAKPVSLCVIETAGGEGEQSTLYLNIGLENGVLLRTVIDPSNGELSDTRTRYLGSKGIRLFTVMVDSQESVLSLSSRPWLSYNYQGNSRLTPLSYDALDFASNFRSEQAAEGIVAIAGNSLRIISLERLGTIFNTIKLPLPYTPRKFAIDEASSSVVVIEGDHNASAEGEAADGTATAMEMDGDATAAAAIRSVKRAGAGKWKGNIRVVDPLQAKTLSLFELERNEMPVSIATVSFAGATDGHTYIVVGAVAELDLKTQKPTSGFLYTFKLVGEGERQTTLELVHKTPVDGIPCAVTGFNGKLLVGVGKLLRLYDLGKRKLLKKCENKHLPNNVVDIKTMGHRIMCCDMKDSYFFVKYRAAENTLVIFADDTTQRWLTQATILDYNTVAGVDKFGNFSAVRLPEDVNDDVDEDPTGSKALWDRGLLNGASQKCEVVASYYLGETALSIQKAVLTPGGLECMVYSTLAGSIGAFVPFTVKEDVDFFQHLEMHLRGENPPLCGRDHLAYRSYYYPVKNVIDGDLCETYNSLDSRKKKSIADELDRTPAEVSKKLEEFRNRYAF